MLFKDVSSPAASLNFDSWQGGNALQYQRDGRYSVIGNDCRSTALSLPLFLFVGTCCSVTLLMLNRDHQSSAAHVLSTPIASQQHLHRTKTTVTQSRSIRHGSEDLHDPAAASRISLPETSAYSTAGAIPQRYLGATLVTATIGVAFSLWMRLLRVTQMPAENVMLCATVSAEVASKQPVPELDEEVEIAPGVFEGYWIWKGHRIRYQRSGTSGPSMILVHGFGANADHWRQNLGPLGKSCKVWAIDLLGYGYSDKPTPCKENPNTLYNFEEWGRQLVDFMTEKIGGPTFVVTNSVGGVAGMQAAIEAPHLVPGVILMNVSLRMLHETKQPPLVRPLVRAFQDTLRKTALGQFFFDNLATPRTLRNVLQQAYSDPETVTDELIDVMLKPGLQPGAVEVFLDFISYSSGPLPEQQLEKLTCPVRIIWGEEDPWEKLEWGREFQKFSCVEDFIPLPGVGHCPHDEAPQQVNPLVEEFVLKHAGRVQTAA